MELGYSKDYQDFYDILLKYCKNLRRLQITQVNFKHNYKCLLQKYEKLEHLDLSVEYYVFDDKYIRTNELDKFFKYNPQLVRSFSCDSYTFWSN